MTKAIAVVPTENGWKYLQQLCKHWSHKLDVELGEKRAASFASPRRSPP